MSALKSISVVGNYAPRCCGIATFTQDLRNSLLHSRRLSAPVTMVSDDVNGYDYPEEVKIVWNEKDHADTDRVAQEINASESEVVSLQHEYGIYGGSCGRHVVELLQKLTMPVVTTCHTVLKDPSPEQRHVMREISQYSSRLVVMAEKGREFLMEKYNIPSHKIQVIPHGIPDFSFSDEETAALRKSMGWEGRKIMLTFGLLSPNKGIEHAVRALPEIVAQHPELLYVVVGATHPNLVKQEGEAYRDSLKKLAEDLGVASNLQFINRFVSRDELVGYINAADIYTTPYLNEAQITSGTLAYAFGLGKPVISTPYWHAAELLADGAGVLVPFASSKPLAEAAIDLFTDDEKRQGMAAMARERGRAMGWKEVAKSYLELMDRAREEFKSGTNVVVIPAETFQTQPKPMELLNLTHLKKMTGPLGIYQHAKFNEPDLAHGYCIDDNARALILMLDLQRANHNDPELSRLSQLYLRFVESGFHYDTYRFSNFMDSKGNWLESEGSADSNGRSIWALGHAVHHDPTSLGRERARFHFIKGVASILNYSAPRTWAFALLGIAEYMEVHPEDGAIHYIQTQLAQRLVYLFNQVATKDWEWFEESVTYDNGVLSRALIVSAQQRGVREWEKIGIRSLSWLLKSQITKAGHFRPIGSNGFWHKGGTPARYDQQAVEAHSMISACIAAFDATDRATWLESAEVIHKWFLGFNDLNLSMVDPETGACFDGLQQDGINRNQGAESVWAYLQSTAEIALAHAKVAEEFTPPRIPEMKRPESLRPAVA